MLASTQLLINLLLICLIVLYTLSVVVVTRVYSIITLVLAYVIVSVIALLYYQSFIAIVLLMVYAGAISIFFIFMVMLLNTQRRSFGTMKLGVGGLLLFFVLFMLVGGLVVENFYNLVQASTGGFNSTNTIVQTGCEFHIHNVRDYLNLLLEESYKLQVPEKFIALQDAPGDLVGEGSITSQLVRIGLALYSAYVYGFIGAGLLLLVAIVGVTSLFNYTPRLQKSREVDSLQVLRGLKNKTNNAI